MRKITSFFDFLLKKAGLERTVDLGFSEEVRQLNQEVRLKNPRVLAGAKDYAAAYHRVREREHTFRKVLNRQLEAGEDILDSSVSMWLDEFREKKQEFLNLKAHQAKDPNSLYHRVLKQENRTHEMIHNLFLHLEAKEAELKRLEQNKLYFTPLSMKLATSAAIALVLAISLVRLSPVLSQAIVDATDSLTVKPLHSLVAWIEGGEETEPELAVQGPLSPALHKDKLAAYIKANSGYISAEAKSDGRVYINKDELAHSQKQIEEEVEVLAETYNYDSFMNRFKRGFKDMVLEMAEKQRGVVDRVEEELEERLR